MKFKTFWSFSVIFCILFSERVNTLKKCGKVKISHRGNIVGGQAAAKGEFPWLVAFFYKGETYFCGGSLISHTHVVTGKF